MGRHRKNAAAKRQLDWRLASTTTRTPPPWLGRALVAAGLLAILTGVILRDRS